MKKTKLPLTILTSGVVAVWQIYDINTATEAPSYALAILQYLLLALASISCIGSIGLYLSGKA